MGCSRHILSTTFTTVAGFSPLLLSGGPFWPPLAVVIAGGVGFSVILSLLFTPAAYALLYRKWRDHKKSETDLPLTHLPHQRLALNAGKP